MKLGETLKQIANAADAAAEEEARSILAAEERRGIDAFLVQAPALAENLTTAAKYRSFLLRWPHGNTPAIRGGFHGAACAWARENGLEPPTIEHCGVKFSW